MSVRRQLPAALLNRKFLFIPSVLYYIILLYYIIFSIILYYIILYYIILYIYYIILIILYYILYYIILYYIILYYIIRTRGGGRVVRRCWVNFQCWGVLLIWIIVGRGPIVLAVGAGGGCLDIFSFIYHFSFLSPSLWETARYRLKYCLKGPLSPK